MLKIKDAAFPAPFSSGLEFSAPARGPWNIVHTGMLIPDSHQIFACARGCLRGVILTAAEMNAMDRMSWISFEENDFFNGRMEESIVEGCTHILKGMKKQPKAVLLFISCIQMFAGIDFENVLEILRAAFPGILFVDCYMHPTMRKSGYTPDQMMRIRLYSGLKEKPMVPKTAAIIGNDRPTDPESELCRMLKRAGYELRDLTLCKTWEEYLSLAECELFITTLPAGKAAGEELCKYLNRKHLHLPTSYTASEIEETLSILAKHLKTEPEETEDFDAALENARKIIGETPVEIDYTATPRPAGLANLLLEHGFRVRKIYADVFAEEERADFETLRKRAPELEISPTVQPEMRFAARKESDVLAIGQKAAYFSGTRRFVNIVSGGGFYGTRGICRLAEEMVQAFLHEKNTEEIIRRKGLGCESCLK